MSIIFLVNMILFGLMLLSKSNFAKVVIGLAFLCLNLYGWTMVRDIIAQNPTAFHLK